MDNPQPRLPTLRDDLRCTPIVEDRRHLYIIEDPVRHIFFRIGLEEYLLASCLNQAKNLDDLLEGATARSGVVFTPEQARTVLNWLASRQLLQTEDSAPLLAAARQDQAMQETRRFNRLNLVSFKLPLLNPDPFLRHVRYLSWLTGWPFFLLWLGVGIVALFTLAADWPLFTGQLNGFFGPGNLFRIWLIWFGLKLLHELFHALVCYRYGGRVYEAGVLFILFMPLTYVNAPSSWQFPSKWQRIHVAVAGMFIELFVAFVAVLLWAQNPTSASGFIAHNTVIIAGISSLLFNANPLMRFDGYYILSDLMGIANLYQAGLQYVRSRVSYFFYGSSKPLPPEKKFIRGYGVAVYLWRFAVLFSLGYLASHLAGGLGMFITLGAAITWMGQPLINLRRQWPLLHQHNPNLLRHLLKRLLMTGVLLAAALHLVSWQKRVEAPAVVEYQEQYSVRTKTSGFVTGVLVADGDKIQAGQMLVTLENIELQFVLEQLRLQMAQLDLKIRLAHSTERLTDLNILQDQKQALVKELVAAEEDTANLTITAPGDGVCISGNLTNLSGTYLGKGQELMWIVSARQKQLTGTAAQNDIDDFRQFSGKTVDVDMRAAGMGIFQARLNRISPTATAALPHSALGAVYGGPLDVRQAALSSPEQGLEQRYRFELFIPRFTLSLDLPPAIQQQVQAGQLATLLIRGTKVTLGSVLWDWGKTWFKHKDTIADGRG